MKIIGILKKPTISIGIMGLIPALFLWWQNWLMQDNSKTHFNSGVGAISIYQELALRYFFISVCFFLYVAFMLHPNKVFLRILSLIPLTFILVQCRLLIMYKENVFKGQWIYSSWLSITFYMDFGFLGLAILMITMNLYVLWRTYRLKSGQELNQSM